MTSTIFYSSPVSHHLSGVHKFPDPYSQIPDDEEDELILSKVKSNSTFINRTLSSIIRSKQVNLDSLDIRGLVSDIDPKDRLINSSGSDSEKESSEVEGSSKTSTSYSNSHMIEANMADNNSDHLNNSVSSASSFSNNSQSVNKSQKSKKKYEMMLLY